MYKSEYKNLKASFNNIIDQDIFIKLLLFDWKKTMYVLSIVQKK